MRRAVIICLMLASCASAGVKVDQSKMAQFQKGKTTEAEVIAALGKPTDLDQNDDGTHTIKYSYLRGVARPETYIPIVGPFVGGVDTEQTTTSLTFDRHDILIRSSHSQGMMGAGVNK